MNVFWKSKWVKFFSSASVGKKPKYEEGASVRKELLSHQKLKEISFLVKWEKFLKIQKNFMGCKFE